MSALIQAQQLLPLLEGERPPLLVDVRWSLDGPDREGYEQGHLPGAVFCDLDAELASPPGQAGRHPLPSREQLQSTMRRLGIASDRDVVVYDGGSGLPSARAWWCLRWAGHGRVRVLDGGLLTWLAAGGTLEGGDVAPVPAPRARAHIGAMPTVTVGDVADGRVDVLLDVRAGERYRGEKEPVDPVAGHIPGAVSLPISEVLADDGRLLPPDQLRAALAPLLPMASPPEGSVAVAAYCGSGVTAAQMVLALHEADVDAALYPGSWSEWIADRSRPVATGD
jgi:thiosulfate/3-mercaptopyruvate sulfurtransferase